MHKGVKNSSFSGRSRKEKAKLGKLKGRNQEMLKEVTQRLCLVFISLKSSSVLLFSRR